MTVGGWLARLAVSRNIGPKWAKRAYRDEQNISLLLAFTLRVDSNCIDVGSHEGRVLADMVRFAPRGLHIAYEPLPHLARHLVAKFPEVDVRNAALSNVDGISDFAYATNLPAYSGFRPRTYPSKPALTSITVTTERLDNHLADDYVPTLIKVDVEGAEQLVFEGALGVLRRHRPTVLFEHGKGGANHYGTSPGDIFRLLCDEAGLRIFDLDGNGPYTIHEFELTYERNDRWNFIAHR